MSPKKKARDKAYIKRKCNHCGNLVTMEQVAIYSGIKSYDNYGQVQHPMEWSAGYVYQTLKCPACEGITFQSYLYHDQMDEPETPQTLYPNEARQILGLPTSIEAAYRAAVKVKNIDANLYAVQLGRVIELLCVEKRARGKSLFEKLENLAKTGIVPSPLVDMAQSLRGFRNIGAHATLGDIQPTEIPFLEDLCRAILEYVYSGPKLIENAKARLEKLKVLRKTKKVRLIIKRKVVR
jgi:hypothetical protein